MTLIILKFACLEPKNFESSRYIFIVWKIILQSTTHINEIRFYGWNTNLN